MKKKKIAVVDRISDLPESLLCHILSFLPTKESVATSILSSRWKLHWTLVPKLDLDSEEISASELLLDDDDEDEYLRESEIMFAHVVSSVLAQQECGELQTFRLRWQFWWDGSNLDAWLRTAAARKVKELDLHIFTDGEKLKLPPSFLSCRTLVVLKLSGTIAIDIDTPSLSFNFPSLKKLLVAISLRSIIYSQETSFLKLLSGCPVLEDLSCTIELFEREYKLCVPTLKRLSIRVADFTKFDYELEINAPALEYFEFYGDLRDIKFYEKLNNLVQADVYISILDYVPEEVRGKWVFNLFAALNSVKFLTFSPRGTEVRSPS